MRLSLVWFVLLLQGLLVSPVRADDFDDDFAQPKPKPVQTAPEPPATPSDGAGALGAPRKPAPAKAAPERPAPAAPAPAAPAPVAPPAPKQPYAAFDDGEPQGPKAAAGAAFDEPAPVAKRAQAQEPAVEPPTLPDEHYRDDAIAHVHGTLGGLVGGLHLVDGAGGPPRTFRLAVAGRLFKKNGFILPGDHARRLGSFFTLGVTPIEHLELAAAVQAYAAESDAADPTLVQAMGDTTFSAKGYGAVLPGLHIAGALELMLLNGTGGVGFATNATSVGLRAALSYDMRETAQKMPIVLRTNLRYLFDNSRRLIEDVEAGRYAVLADPAPRADEYRHLVTATERYQLGANRVDSFLLGFGAEFPIQLGHDLDVRPLIEWTIALPVNRQGYDCLVSNDPSDTDSCLAREGFSARPSMLTLGVRGEPGIRGLSLLLAIDVSTGGHATYVRELSPNSRYELTGMLSYAYDTRPPRPVVIVREREPEPLPERGRIRGLVLDQEGQQPVARAIVHVQGATTSDLATDADGRFTSEPLDPGSYPLALSHDDYHDGTCEAVVPEGEAGVDVRCTLAPKPRFATVRGRVTNTDGAPLAGATVELRGPTPRTVQTDASGSFEVTDLTPGEYEARAEAPDYLLRATPFEAKSKQEATLSLVLAPVPKERLTELETKKITIKKQIQFVADSAEISEKSSALLAEIADLLLRNPQVARVEVQGHTDYTGTATYNLELSQARADAVRNALIAAGVEPKRLTAVGYGLTRPIAPNITEANRARNRRVAFVIVEGEK